MTDYQTPPAKVKKRKQTNLETANQMFKDAFLVKRTRFSKENPHLTDADLDKMTAGYFRKLNEGESS